MVVLLRGIRFVYFVYFSILFAVLIILAFPLTLIFLLLPKKICDRAMFLMMKAGSYILFTLSGIIPRNYHRDKVSFDQSYIIIPTHQSYIEAATIYTSIPTLFKTLGKKELEKTPLYGLIFKAVCITVDRSSLSARAMSFRKMKHELDQGLSIIIFPEGTFADMPQPSLLPFQDGSFSLAILQQTDLLPVLYPDSCLRMHPGQFTQMSPGPNRAIFLPPVRVKGFQKKDTQALKVFCEKYMQACLDHFHEKNIADLWSFAIHYQEQNLPQFS